MSIHQTHRHAHDHDHGHENGHVHDGDHGHAHLHARVSVAVASHLPGFSLLRLSALERLAGAAALAGLIWAGVFWALG
jgi:hypothetical protein